MSKQIMADTKRQRSNEDSPSEPFFPPLSTARRAIPLTDRAGKLAFCDYEPGLSIEYQIERVIVSSRVGYIVFQMRNLDITDREFFQRILAETQLCLICRNESRPNHLIKSRIRKEWHIHKTINKETVQKLEDILAIAGHKLGRRFHLEAEILEKLQAIYHSSLSSEEIDQVLTKELTKGKDAVVILEELSELAGIGALEGDPLYWGRA